MKGQIKKCFISGDFIGVSEDVNTFSVSKIIDVSDFESAVLKVTALGLYVAKINGIRVGENYLTPGFTTYKKIVQVQTYDVSSMLKKGENTIEFIVNKGWYAGRFGLYDAKEIFGKNASVLASLIVTDRKGNITTYATDKSWKARESYIVSSGIYDGEVIDYSRKLNYLNTVARDDVDKNILIEQISEPVTNHERFKVQKVIRTPKGELVYDFGQNIAGVVEVTTDSPKEIVLQFAEILDENGNFYKVNLRSASGECTIKTSGPVTTDFEFTYYGFRYVKVVTENVEKEDIVAVARYSNLERTGYLETSHKKLNRFILNTLWSQRDNFVDIPTDCPQRDERLGWTGDINAFCVTAAYTYDTRLFIKKWLACLRCDQLESGALPVVSPEVINFSGTMSMWCDASIMVPWKMYCQYGDVSFLSDNYDMMKKYLSARENTCENGMVNKGFEYGDWLALDSETCVENKVFGGTDLRYIGNLFYYECLKTTAKISKILGFSEDEKKYRNRAEKLLFDIRNEYITPNGRVAVSTITAQVLALTFGILKENERIRVAKDLNDKVINHGFHVTTGFIGTAYLLFALSDNGYAETAEKVLLNEEFPGWLHEVNIGATTVWERWDSLLPDGTPNPEGMTSFNHYAYGSVLEFIWRRVAGIESDGVGFEKIKIAPHPLENVDKVSAVYKSVRGEIKLLYERKDGKVFYDIEVPHGVETTILLPDGVEKKVNGGIYKF